MTAGVLRPGCPGMHAGLPVALLAGVLLIGALVVSGSANAQAENDAEAPSIPFTVRPLQANLDRPESFAYFSRVQLLDQTLHEFAVVTNLGREPLDLKVYAANALTAVNGGTSFAHAEAERDGVAAWIGVSLDEVSLGGGGTQVVPFTIDIPEGTAPGEYVAGIVVEPVPPEAEEAEDGTAVEDAAQFLVEVVPRVGVAVVVTVPGERAPELTLISAGLDQQSESGATFVLEFENPGNVMLRADGILRVTDLAGTELAVVSVTVGTVLPRDVGTIYFGHPIFLGDGQYLVEAELQYAAVLGDETGPVLIRELEPITVVDGAPASDDVDLDEVVSELQVISVTGTPIETAQALGSQSGPESALAVTPVGTNDDSSTILYVGYALGVVGVFAVLISPLAFRRRRV